MAYKYMCILNEDNYYMDFTVAEIVSGKVNSISVDIPEGFKLKDYPIPGDGMVKPKWDEDLLDWVEGATEEEIAKKQEEYKLRQFNFS